MEPKKPIFSRFWRENPLSRNRFPTINSRKPFRSSTWNEYYTKERQSRDSNRSATNAGSTRTKFCVFRGRYDCQRTLVIRIAAITLASDSAITIARFRPSKLATNLWSAPNKPPLANAGVAEIAVRACDYWSLTRLSDVQLTFFHADFGKEFPSRNLWRGPSLNCPSPSSALCLLLYRTEQFSRGRKGRKCAEKRG